MADNSLISIGHNYCPWCGNITEQYIPDFGANRYHDGQNFLYFDFKEQNKYTYIYFSASCSLCKGEILLRQRVVHHQDIIHKGERLSVSSQVTLSEKNRQLLAAKSFNLHSEIEDASFEDYNGRIVRTWDRFVILLPEVLYPKAKISLPSEAPEKIKKLYHEAKKVKPHSKTSYSVLLRKCLEALCNDQKAEGTRLVDKIESLGKKGVIPPNLIEHASIIRFFGNIGAHQLLEDDFTDSDIELADEFFRALVEYLYVMPVKTRTLRNRLSQLKNPHTKKRI